MKNITICSAGASPALDAARRALADKFHIVERPAPDVTHLLLPVPSFERDGRIKGGGILENILADLPENLTIIGGNLQHPALAGYPCIDLLQDGQYVAMNAAFTADCAIRVLGAHLPECFDGCPILVIGWGRIGKCLAAKLKALGAKVAVAARKPQDRNMLRALGYDTENTQALTGHYQAILNTVPAPILTQADIPRKTVRIELASAPGLSGSGVMDARGLPGKMVPESSGRLIAQSIAKILEERRI